MGTCLQPEALKFLRGLARHNDREWFEARRGVYEQQIKAPMLALIEEVNAAMTDFAPEHIRPPARTMMRIYRDTRFSIDKRPYKKHVAAWFGRKGSVRTSGAGFYLHISGSEVQFGAGVFVPLPEEVLAVRRWMAERHADYRRTLKRVTNRPKNALLLEPANGNPLARMPKGFPADHPAGELLRARRWGVGYTGSSDAALGPDFSHWLIQAIERAAPLVSALAEALDSAPSAAGKQPRKALF